jgi:integrase
MLNQNPFYHFKKSILFEEDRGRVRYLTEDEIKSLLSWSPPYLKNIIKAAILTGLRKSDLLRLRWDNVDLGKGVLFYNEQKKRDKLRIKVLNSDMIDLLMDIKATSEYIFTDPEGKPLKDVKIEPPEESRD